MLVLFPTEIRFMKAVFIKRNKLKAIFFRIERAYKLAINISMAFVVNARVYTSALTRK
jgi:shikimate kinase